MHLSAAYRPGALAARLHPLSELIRPRAADPRVDALRLRAQGLAGPPSTTVEDVVQNLLSVQAQDARGARLAVRARTSAVLAADVDAALTERRSVVISWLNRGTLHMVPSADYWWLHALLAPRLVAGNRRRLEQEGVSTEDRLRALTLIGEALLAHGPLTRTQLRRTLEGAGIPTAGQALVHLLVAATLTHTLVRGPLMGREHAFALAETWLGPAPAALPAEEVLAKLARRYLVGHAPASAEDLARWAGISLGEARRGFAAIARETCPIGVDGLVALEPLPADAVALPAPRLLGPFDPVLLGWVSREPIIGSYTGIVTSNGIFRPFALVNGRAVAIWGLAGGRLSFRPLERLSEDILDELRHDGRAVMQFLGLNGNADLVIEVD